mgnify:CR=1 FL=1
MGKPLHILLIEDDMNTCNRISNYIATKDNMDLVGVTNNSYVGIQYVQNTLPDAVILDPVSYTHLTLPTTSRV